MPASRHVTWQSFVRLLPSQARPQSYWRLYAEFWVNLKKIICCKLLPRSSELKFLRIFLVKNCWRGPPSPVECGLASFGHTQVRVKIWGGSTPMGRNMVFQKSWFGWVQTHAFNFVVSGPKFTGFFFCRTRQESLSIICFSGFGYLHLFQNVCDRSLKLSKIAPNFARFWLPNFFCGKGPPNFGQVIK